MKKTQSRLHIILIAAAINVTGFSLQSAAETRYITDIIYTPLRADKNNQSEVVKAGLATGTKLTFIREEEDANKNKWALVSTSDGIEGWVRSQNLISEPTAAMKLQALSSTSSNLIELQQQNITLKAELETLNTSYQTLLKETEASRSTNASDINMQQENQTMHREYQLLQTERDVLKAENEQLNRNHDSTQRIYGAALILVGIGLSFLLQSFGKRKRYSEWN
jgi:SH3 domain protein